MLCKRAKKGIVTSLKLGYCSKKISKVIVEPKNNLILT